MWIFDDAKNVPERVEDGGDPNPAADILHRTVSDRAKRNQPFKRRLRVRDAPIAYCTAWSGGFVGGIRVQSQFVTAHVESNIKWLVKIGLDPENRRIPNLGPFKIRCMINDGAHAQEI